jgi:YYY domain-containing protein
MEYGLVAGWLALYLVLLRAGQPLAARLLPWHGSGLALPVALAVVWLVTFWVGHLALGPAIWLGVAVLVGAAVLLDVRSGADPVPDGYLEAATVFTVAFLVLVAVRAVDPAIVPGGGEKFLDFGLLKSLVRADALPAEDVWFAGRPFSYYYGGHLLAAALTRLTGTAGRFAYNLALAGFYATLVTAVYGLAGQVATSRGTSRRLGAALGAFFVGVAANLLAAGRLLVWLVPGGEQVATALGVPVEGLAAGPGEFSYWSASRVIVDDPADFAGYTPGIAPTINEFPLFAWLNGDLHAHMMSTAFLVLVAGLCFSYYRTDADRVRRRRLLLFGAVPAVGGLIAVTSTWSFPSVAGLVFVTAVLAPATPRTLLPAPVRGRLGTDDGLRGEFRRVGVSLLAAGSVLALGVVWSLPFWVTSVTSRTVAVFPDRSSLGELLVVHGVFLAVFAGYLYVRGTETLGTRRTRVGAAASVVLVGAAAVLDVAALGLVAPLVALGWLFARRPALPWLAPARADGSGEGRGETATGDGPGGGRRPGFEAVLLVAGAGLVVLVEFVFIRENVGRMNTVFKTYMQVWVLWSLAAGAALAWLLTRFGGWRGRALRVGAALLLVSASVYGGFALANHFTSEADIARTDEPTLDGLAYLDVRHPGEAPAVQWLDSREGRPTILTAAPGGYSWYPPEGRGASAPASLTGLPTVLGWFHEAQYRGEAAYSTRLEAVRLLYEGAPNQQAILAERYDLRYVYVGPAERTKYDVSVDERPWTEVAREFEDVTVYQVNATALGDSEYLRTTRAP